MTFSDRRKALRDLSREDPFTKPSPSPVIDGQVQVGDGLALQVPADYSYKDHKYANSVQVAAQVADDEAITPGLDVGSDKLNFHRAVLKDLLCRQEPSHLSDKSGTPKSLPV